jgi:hypothetical protein
MKKVEKFYPGKIRTRAIPETDTPSAAKSNPLSPFHFALFRVSQLSCFRDDRSFMLKTGRGAG